MSDSVTVRLVLDGEDRTFDLQHQLVVGRIQADITIPSGQVSKRHAVLQFLRGHVLVTDLGSRNGTLLNHRPLEPRLPTPVAPGDTVWIGPAALTFDWGTAPQGFDAVIESAKTLSPEHFQPFAALTPEERERDYERLRLAHELAERLIDVKEASTVFSELEKTCQQVPGWGNARVRSGSSATTMLGDGTSTVMDATRPLTRQVVEAREAVLLGEPGNARALAVPLNAGPDLAGVLAVEGERRLHSRDLKLVVDLARQASKTLTHLRLVEHSAKEARTRALLGRFVAPALVERIHRGEQQLEPGGQLKEVVVLASDIAGFTGLSEQLGPEATMRFLNTYFERMVAEVFREQGALDKFIGDAIFATWGTLTPLEPVRAVRAAIGMMRALEELNRERRARGEVELRHRIGIHLGPAVVGLLGARERLEYTVIGDTANVASRLESAAQPLQILVSAEVAAACRGQVPFRTLAPVRVKGKAEPIPVYEVRTDA